MCIRGIVTSIIFLGIGINIYAQKISASSFLNDNIDVEKRYRIALNMAFENITSGDTLVIERIEDTDGVWAVDSTITLSAKSNITILLEEGVNIIARSESYNFDGFIDTDSRISRYSTSLWEIRNCNNLNILAYGASLNMPREEYDNYSAQCRDNIIDNWTTQEVLDTIQYYLDNMLSFPAYAICNIDSIYLTDQDKVECFLNARCPYGERHGLNFTGDIINAKIYGLKVLNSGGTGINFQNANAESIVIKDCKVEGSYRNGIELNSLNNLELSHTVLSNSSGFGHNAGLLFNGSSYLDNINIQSSRLEHNDSAGILLRTGKVNNKDYFNENFNVLDLAMSNCHISGSKYGLVFDPESNNFDGGNFTLEGLVVDSIKQYAYWIKNTTQKDEDNPNYLKFQFLNSAVEYLDHDPNATAVRIDAASSACNQTYGGLEFDNFVFNDCGVPERNFGPLVHARKTYDPNCRMTVANNISGKYLHHAFGSDNSGEDCLSLADNYCNINYPLDELVQDYDPLLFTTVSLANRTHFAIEQDLDNGFQGIFNAGLFRLSRVNPTTNYDYPLAVRYRLSSTTEEEGNDYRSHSHVAVFRPGETVVDLAIVAREDQHQDGGGKVKIELIDEPSCLTYFVQTREITMTILDTGYCETPVIECPHIERDSFVTITWAGIPVDSYQLTIFFEGYDAILDVVLSDTSVTYDDPFGDAIIKQALYVDSSNIHIWIRGFCTDETGKIVSASSLSYCLLNDGLISNNQEVLNPENLQVYPNPVEDILSVKSDRMFETIRAYNSIGQLVYEKNAINHREIKIDVSPWENGIYFIIATGHQGTVTQSIIKK